VSEPNVDEIVALVEHRLKEYPGVKILSFEVPELIRLISDWRKRGEALSSSRDISAHSVAPSEQAALAAMRAKLSRLIEEKIRWLSIHPNQDVVWFSDELAALAIAALQGQWRGK
jgi:hypothetical protein